MNSNKKIKYLKDKVPSKDKVNFTEFFIHLFFLILSFISILKCKITKIKICNYSISLPKTKGGIAVLKRLEYPETIIKVAEEIIKKI